MLSQILSNIKFKSFFLLRIASPSKFAVTSDSVRVHNILKTLKALLYRIQVNLPHRRPALKILRRPSQKYLLSQKVMEGFLVHLGEYSKTFVNPKLQ